MTTCYFEKCKKKTKKTGFYELCVHLQFFFLNYYQIDHTLNTILKYPLLTSLEAVVTLNNDSPPV